MPMNIVVWHLLHLHYFRHTKHWLTLMFIWGWLEDLSKMFWAFYGKYLVKQGLQKAFGQVLQRRLFSILMMDSHIWQGFINSKIYQFTKNQYMNQISIFIRMVINPYRKSIDRWHFKMLFLRNWLLFLRSFRSHQKEFNCLTLSYGLFEYLLIVLF